MKRLLSCPLCDGVELTPFAMSAGAGLHGAQVRCGRCGLVAADPQAEPRDLEAYYATRYYQEQWTDPCAQLATNTATYRRYEWPLMQSLWSRWPPPAGGRLGEVGCGYGIMLRLLRDEGYRVEGCELSPHAAAFCREAGLQVHVGSQLSRSGLDGVLLLQVIEHVPDPQTTITQLVNTTRPGGVVVVSTEDALNSQYQCERALSFLRGRLPRYRSSTDHTFVFQAHHLVQLLRAGGCDEVFVKAYTILPDYESLHWRLYKGAFRALDRITNHGEFLIAVGRRAARADQV